ncbi:S9 family peptidase [Novosphingobium flavum]|uniref:S9 family peptidase n=1 Tax=Novosphingobium aerophilum TaxID=2839843 RepID=A0A7X1F7Z6_9SPHN|nr:S9 family peptidase [Novosphingobium aerophilum]MBC2651924.1 S9 family peptidase [Novosphingobium aerophilum]MBC2661677.1 S9 family peptidase [Novosphingobium aerophilum]
MIARTLRRAGARSGRARMLAAPLLFALGGAFGPTALAAPPPLEAYGRLPGFEDAAISPSGRHVAMLATIKGGRTLLVIDQQGALVTSFPFGMNDKLRAIRWAGDQAVLVSYSVTAALPMGFITSKTELGAVFVLPLDKSPPWAVFHDDHDITGGVRGTFGLIERDGRWFGYFGGVTLVRGVAGSDSYLPTGAVRPDLYEVDLQTRKSKRIARRAEDGDAERDWLVDGHGMVGATLNWVHSNGHWTLLNGQHATIASGVAKGSASLIGFTPDGSGVVYSTQDDAGVESRWFTVPIAGGTPQPFLDDLDVDRVWLDKGRQMTGYTSGRAGGGSAFFDPARDKAYRKLQAAFAGKRLSIESASDDFDHLLVKVDGGDDPGTWYRVDVSQHRAAPIGFAYPLDPKDVGSSRFISYTASDGQKMEGVLTLPPGRTPRNLPAVVMPHGGPTAHDEPGFDWWAQAYASRGYAVFQPNFRGSTGYGDAFQQAGHGEWGRKMQTDISDGVAELVRQGIIDPKRMAIVGASYGGYAALAGVTLQQGLYRCAVSVAGIGDLGRFVAGRINDYQDAALNRALKAEIGTGRDLKLVSPQRYADKVTVPVMLIHGKDDTVVDYAQSSAMANALRDAGKPVEFVTLQGEDHWLSKSATRQAMLEASVNFVLKHNPPDPEPAGETKR